jgi:hypothetical protein
MDAVVNRRAEVVLERRASRSIVRRLRSMFSQTPIRDVED